MEIAIIGAGVVGLSTALSIQEAFPDVKLTLFADKFNENTLSSGAGGYFYPVYGFHYNSDLVRKWSKVSFDHFNNLLQSSEASSAGIQLVSGYILQSTENAQGNLVNDVLPEYRKLNRNELQLFPNHFKDGKFITSIIADCSYYLPWMKSKFEKNGGAVVEKHISSICEIPKQFGIVVNCAGLAANELVQDNTLVPIRGQTIKVKAPWIKHAYYGDEVYVLPGIDFVTLGAIKDYNCWDTNVRLNQKQYIWEKCLELVPSLEKAEFAWDWVGLRPFRPSVRVDASFVNCDGNHRLVLNNYGHGSYGVTFSWGTAQEITEILQKILAKKDLTLAKL